jgi:multidrug efflux pump subunit AcrB
VAIGGAVEESTKSQNPIVAVVPLMLFLMATILMVQVQSFQRSFLVPIAREIFWGPMAYAMMDGIIVGTLLTLLFLPALYVAWFRIKETKPCAH